jgi:hypothetical protein
MSPRDLLAFSGKWSLSREIADRRAGHTGRAKGQATLREGGGGLIYEEHVLLEIADAPPLQGTRRYLWRAVSGGIAISFEDGRAFHELGLTGDAAVAAHWCDPDHYEVTYDFSAWPKWVSHWEVRGPRKDYAMTTRYGPVARH